MTTPGSDGKTRLWVIAIGALLFVATLAVVYRRRPDRQTIPRFPVPSADRVAPNSAGGTAETVVPSGQLMTLDPTKKFLISSITNKPIFVTGEDAWSLEVQLSDADVQSYLADREARGFNAIWVGLADNAYSNHPPKDFYGNVPFNGADFTNENPAYWEHVDRTLSWAAQRGIAVFASPAFVGFGCRDGYCESYRNSSTAVLTAYGKFLGNRYKEFSNIIWLIGGDADPADSDVQAKLYALAAGIKSEDRVHLMTTENYRGSSSEDVWSGSPWLDLDALYLKPLEIPAKANADYEAGNYPIFMMEDWYEGDHSMTELDVRKEGYWAVLGGCTLGRLFGNNTIWNFNWPEAPSGPWKGQLGSVGSVGQSILGKLFRSREHWLLVPDIHHRVLTAGYDSRPSLDLAKERLRSVVYQVPFRTGSNLSVAARTSDGRTIIAYVPNGNAATITVDMGRISDPASQAKCWWYNPRDGSSTSIGNFAARGFRKFTPPDANDWVLTLDSATANLPAPGSTSI
jgi:Protein of unknown function (DUF4038)/Putative collagen-binding domain of a collagenase